MMLNPTLVILSAVVLVLGIIFMMERNKRKKKIEEIEGVILFGEKVTTQDYISFCNTCISYLLISIDKKLDMSLFIQEEKLKAKDSQESMRMIEQTINLFPIIQCKWVKDYVFIVDEEKTIKKIEDYQNNTGSDDYVIPLFDVGVVSRNPNIFTISTRYQQAKTVEQILTTRGIGDQFEGTEDIVKGLNSLANNDEKYITPDILYSERNMQEV